LFAASTSLSLATGQRYHYHQNAETYRNVGRAMGRAMVDLL